MNESQVFTAALKLPAAADRAAFLDRACAGDALLRAAVEDLLRARASDPDFLEHPAAGRPTATADPGPAERPGAVLAGRYKLLEEVGEGGMGTVWMAQQTEPVRRTVAVKVIKPGMDSKQVLARFEAERQALALMDHPNIAKVLDAGTTGGDRPYFVMELVKGVPVTRYCDDHHLTPRERLNLFVPVCQAVQHAHQKGVIHRDLKPGNVLVALYDDKPVPKVIDFGVAKATGQALTEATLHTSFGAVVGTVEYMSPEQATFNQLDVDTRSDVYSLGVLLYELLTGTTPLDRKRQKDTPLLELLRIVREDDTVRPSARLSTVEELPTIAARRGVEPRRLSGLVCGELDWIVMRALEKDRSRRYESAAALAADVERYLAGEAVQACPPSPGYRFRKFARRNRAALGGVALVGVTGLAVLALGGFAVVLGYYQRAEAAYRSEADARQGEAEARRAEAEAAEQKERFHYYERIALARLTLRDEPDLAERMLDDCPALLRGWEWHYLHALFHAELFTIPLGGSNVGGVAFTADGTFITYGGPDGRVSLRDPATGREVRALDGHPGPVHSLSVSRDGKRLASAGRPRGGPARGELKVWDLAAGTELASVPETAQRRFSCVAISSDGRWAATGLVGGGVVVWNADTGREAFTLTPALPGIGSVAFSPDGKFVAGGGAAGGAVTVWDTATRQPVHSLGGKGAAQRALVFRPDGEQFASVSWEGTVRVWDRGTGREVFTLRGNAAAYAVAYSPDGTRLATGGADRAATVWEAATGRPVATYLGHQGSVGPVAFSPDGRRLASRSEDLTVKVWDATRVPQSLVLRGHARSVAGAAFSPDGSRLVTAGTEAVLKAWDPASGRELGSTAFPPDGAEFPVGVRVSFSPGGTYLAAPVQGNAVKVCEAATGRLVHTLRGHTQPVLGTAFSPDGKRLASSSSDRSVRVWDVTTGQQVLTIPHLANVVAFSPDGRLATGGMDGSVRLRDPATGRELVTLPPPGSDPPSGMKVFAMAFSPDGRRVAWVDDPATIRVWDVGGRRQVLSFAHVRGAAGLTSVAFSPDGRRIATGTFQGGVKLWDAVTGENVFAFPRQDGVIRTLLFSPDGRRLAADAGGGAVNVWDAGPGAAWDPTAPEPASP